MAAKRKVPTTSGFLNIDKPPGWTSHDVVARVRRIVGERSVGHAGTLDPAATGVLPIAVGHATSVLRHLESDDKRYVAMVRFGVETDSGDRDGRLISQQSVEQLDFASVKSVAQGFVGTQRQYPPMQSAVKVGGRRLYESSRMGEDVEVPARLVTIHRCDLVSLAGCEAILSVACGKGTYIRSLVRDIGRHLGCGASLAHLVRVQSGMFHLRASISIHDLQVALDTQGWSLIASHPDFALRGHDVTMLSPDELSGWFNGQKVQRATMGDDVSVYGPNRDWIGVGVFDSKEGALKPKRVIRGDDR